MDLTHRFDGPPDAPVVVLGPSLGTTIDLWSPQLDALTEHWRVLRYDLPGHGNLAAPAPSDPSVLSIDDLAAAVLKIVDRHGISRFGYAGVSLGGAIGSTLAVTVPDRLAALVLCCTAAKFGTPEAWRQRAAMVRAQGTGPLAETAASRWFTPAFGSESAEPYLAMLRGVDPAGYAACCDALAGFDVRGRLDRVRAPTLVIAGAQDPATPPADAELLVRGIPGANLIELPGAAHLANVERPAEVTRAIRDHLESHLGRM